MSADPAPSGPPPTGPIRAALVDWKDAASRYLAARMALFRIEAGEAAEGAARKGKLITSGLFLLLAAYGLLWAGLLGLAEHYREGTWPLAALIAAGCHLLIGLPLLLAASRKPPRPYFEQSLHQWKEDELWMKRMASRGSKKDPTN